MDLRKDIILKTKNERIELGSTGIFYLFHKKPGKAQKQHHFDAIIKLCIGRGELKQLRTFNESVNLTYNISIDEQISNENMNKNSIKLFRVPVITIKIEYLYCSNENKLGFVFVDIKKDKASHSRKEDKLNSDVTFMSKLQVTPVKKSPHSIKTEAQKLVNASNGLKLTSIESVSNKKSCPICLESILHIATTFPCKHLFCKKCILAWAETSTFCPVCKNEFHKIEAKALKKYFKNPKMFTYENIDEEEENWYRGLIDHCMVCKGKEEDYLMIVCNKCNRNVCHYYCDGLDKIPYDDWYCSVCRNEGSALKSGDSAIAKDYLHKKRNILAG